MFADVRIDRTTDYKWRERGCRTAADAETVMDAACDDVVTSQCEY